MGEMDVTSTKNPEGTGKIFCSFIPRPNFLCKKPDRTLFTGFINKTYKESIWNSAATGIAIDIGTLYESTFPGLKLE